MASKSAAIAGLARSIRALTKVPSQVSREFAAFVDDELERQFITESDVYGRQWQALAPSTVRRKGHNRINYETGALMGSAQAFPLAGAGVGMSMAPHGVYSQVKRPVLPNAGMPATWRRELERMVSNAIADQFG